MAVARESAQDYLRGSLPWRTPILWLGGWLLAGVIAYKVPNDGATVALLGWTLLSGVVALFAPRWGLYALVASTLLIEQDNPTAGMPIFTANVPLFWDSSSFTKIPLALTPSEILLAMVLLGWGIRQVRFGRGLALFQSRLAIPALSLAGVLVIQAAHGVFTGGDFKVALWEIRGPAYTLVLVLLVGGLIEKRAHLRTLLWILIIGVIWTGFVGLWIAVVDLNLKFSTVETLVGHDDAAHIAGIMLLLVAFIIIGSDRAPRWTLIAASPVLGFVLIATQRRDAIVAFAMGLAVLLALRLRERPRDAVKFALGSLTILLLAGVLYVVPGGNVILAEPIRAFTSAFNPSSSRDAASNQYRENERVGLRQTIRQSPLIGVGYGQRYDVPANVFYIGVPLYQYITHDDLLRVWAKTGTLGFAAYWVFWGAAMVEGALVYRRLRDPRLQAIAGFVLAYIAMQLTIHTVDMAMTFYRSMILLGVVVGLILTLERIETSEVAQCPNPRH